MSTQIAIRLPNHMVVFLDQAVAAGLAPSRAALVARALEREMRRQAAEADVAALQPLSASDSVTWSDPSAHHA